MYNKHLDAFLMVAQHGSFSKAAAAMYISTPSLVQQINILEAHLGVKLFKRTNRGAELTEAGDILAQESEKLMALSNQIKERLLIADNIIHIGAGRLYPCQYTKQIWDAVMEKEPTLNLEFTDIPPVFSKLLGRSCDIIETVYYSELLGGYDFFEISKSPLCCAVRKGHSLAGKECVAIGDLMDQKIIHISSGCSIEADQLVTEMKASIPHANFKPVNYYTESVFSMCEMQNCVLITPACWADVHKELVTIPAEWDYSIPYGYVFPRTPTPAVQKFLNVLREL